MVTRSIRSRLLCGCLALPLLLLGCDRAPDPVTGEEPTAPAASAEPAASSVDPSVPNAANASTAAPTELAPAESNNRPALQLRDASGALDLSALPEEPVDQSTLQEPGAVLPDLFDQAPDAKRVSTSGKLLTKDDESGLALDTIEGVEVRVEMRTK